MLQFITHTNASFDYLSGAEQVLQGGGKWIQLRMKDAHKEDIISTGKALKSLCVQYGATLIIDDHVDLVNEIHAHGVHLGKMDIKPSEARKILGDKAIIGGTANEFDDIQNLVAQGVDYIGLGPFRFTSTKKVLSPMIGLEGYEEIIKQCKAHNITTPIVAIGGITIDDIKSILNTGINGIALSGSILNAACPKEETRTILNLINI